MNIYRPAENDIKVESKMKSWISTPNLAKLHIMILRLWMLALSCLYYL